MDVIGAHEGDKPGCEVLLNIWWFYSFLFAI